MNALFLLAEAESEGRIEQITRTFGVDWQHLIAQIISFSIVCLLLYLFAYKRILHILAERRQAIAESLDNSAKIKAELAQTEAQRREVMAQANVQANQFIEEARRAAARLQEQETRKATAAAEAIIANARASAAQDHDRMLVELKQEVGRLVLQTTSAVTGKVLTAEDQRRLAEETAMQLKDGMNKQVLGETG
ncbi:MAG: ATP synthase F0 subunit B [Blastocatellia bacterium]|nr:ATP synthase F0 subunit B [Blastocatellia bacterium]